MKWERFEEKTDFTNFFDGSEEKASDFTNFLESFEEKDFDFTNFLVKAKENASCIHVFSSSKKIKRKKKEM